SKLRGSSCKGQSLLDRRRSNAGVQAGFHVDRLGTRDMGLHQALRVQARLSRWLGRLRHCLWKLRGHLLPLCEALRRNQSLAAAHRRTTAEARAPGYEMMTTSGWRRYADPIAATKKLGICPAALWWPKPAVRMAPIWSSFCSRETTRYTPSRGAQTRRYLHKIAVCNGRRLITAISTLGCTKRQVRVFNGTTGPLTRGSFRPWM